MMTEGQIRSLIEEAVQSMVSSLQDSTRGVNARFADPHMFRADDGAGEAPHPWQASVSGTTLTFTECWVLVGMTFVDLGSIEVDVSLASSGDFVGLVYDSDNDALGDALSVAVGGDGTAYDASFDPSSQYVRHPLCKLVVLSGTVMVQALSKGIPHFMVYKATA